MEEVERMNVIMVCPNQQTEFISCNLYAIDMDKGNYNCYNCGEVEHLAKNYRNKENKIEEGKRLEYRNKDQRQNNLNRKEDLITLD